MRDLYFFETILEKIFDQSKQVKLKKRSKHESGSKKRT